MSQTCFTALFDAEKTLTKDLGVQFLTCEVEITVIYLMSCPNRNFISYIKFPYDYILGKQAHSLR